MRSRAQATSSTQAGGATPRLHAVARDEAGRDHHRGIRRVGARRDRGDADRAVAERSESCRSSAHESAFLRGHRRGAGENRLPTLREVAWRPAAASGPATVGTRVGEIDVDHRASIAVSARRGIAKESRCFRSSARPARPALPSRPVERKYASVASSMAKKPHVAPYSGAMLASVARSGMLRSRDRLAEVLHGAIDHARLAQALR